MNLLRVEIKRILSRRLIRGLTMLAVAGFAFGGTAAFIASDDSPERVAAAREQRAVAIQDCLTRVEQEAAIHPEEFPPNVMQNPRQFCEDETYGGDPRFAFKDFEWMLMSVGMPLVMLAWLLGASSIGAEWANRTMTTSLTWESRRTRVLAAKVLAAAAVSFAWILLLQGIFAGALYPAAEFEGSTVGVDLGWWVDLGGRALAISSVGAIAAILGASIATVGRYTAAALGAGFVYLAVVEGLVRAYRPGWTDWLVGDNAALVMFGSEDMQQIAHSRGAALLLLMTYGAILFLGALYIFQRRDLA